MRNFFHALYREVRKHSLYSFWRDLLHEKQQILKLLLDDNNNLMENSSYIEYEEDLDDTDFEQPIKKLSAKTTAFVTDCLEMDFLSLGCGLGTQEYVGQRVQQITSIMRNLSFFEENTIILAKNRTLMRFLIMGANIRWGNLHHQVLDVAGNVAHELDILDPTLDIMSRSLMATLCDGVEGADRGVIISCLEIIYKLCQKDSNEEHVAKCLNQQFYQTLCTYLSLNDIMLLLYTLEAIYALTSMGNRTCNNLVQVKGIVDQLVSLITVEVCNII